MLLVLQSCSVAGGVLLFGPALAANALRDTRQISVSAGIKIMQREELATDYCDGQHPNGYARPLSAISQTRRTRQTFPHLSCHFAEMGILRVRLALSTARAYERTLVDERSKRDEATITITITILSPLPLNLRQRGQKGSIGISMALILDEPITRSTFLCGEPPDGPSPRAQPTTMPDPFSSLQYQKLASHVGRGLW